MDKVAKEVLGLIESHGYEAYLVGGYPRDYLLNNVTEDFDICTSAKKEVLEEIFNVVFKDNFGSIILNYKNKIFEITTYRKEISYDGVRTPKIVYTSNLSEDIKRRDFTINTICLNSKGEVIDLLGGLDDLKRKIIKCVGEPNKKMSEDPLRILRAIRFACIYNFKIDKDLEHAIKVQGLSNFRKKQELDKIFDSENVLIGIELLRKYDICKYLDITIPNIVITSRLGIWAQIDYSKNYIFNNFELQLIRRIRDMLNKKTISNYDLYMNDYEIVKIVSNILQIDNNCIEDMYNKLAIKTRSDIDITYKDIIENTKIKVSIIYKELEKKILDGSIENNRRNIVEYIRKVTINDIDK